MKQPRYLINICLVLLFTLGALYLALKDNFDLVYRTISSLNPILLLIILGWGALYTIVWGLVFAIYGKKYVPGYRLRQGVSIAFVGAFFAGITPSSTGGQFGQAYILKKQGMKMSHAVSVLWTDFVIYQATMMAMVTVLFLLKFQQYSSQNMWFNIILVGYLINFIVIVVLMTVPLLPGFYTRLAGWLAKLVCKLHLSRNPEHLKESWTLQVHSFTQESKILLQDKKRLFYSVLVNIVRIGLLCALPYVIARAMNIHLSLAHLVDVMALSSFVLMANSFIPIPGASGGTEVVFLLLFSPLMHQLTSAVMVLWRFSSYHLVILLGAIIFILAKARYERGAKRRRKGIV